VNELNSFKSKWTALEDRFRIQAEAEEATYLPVRRPDGPVDFILVAMEPSSRGPRATLNFCSSRADFILHHCVREYLCRSIGTYHLTDLAKGRMTVPAARAGCKERYARWRPLLVDEFALLSKPEGATRVIALGGTACRELRDIQRSGSMTATFCGETLHHSPGRAHINWPAAADRDRPGYRLFLERTLTGGQLRQSAEITLGWLGIGTGPLAEHYRRLCAEDLVEIEQKLAFRYFVDFGRVVPGEVLRP
jgi:hypothetical protein